MENKRFRIVDVGAAGGIDPRWSAICPEHHAILFEPDKEAYDKLKPDDHTTVFNMALSDAKETRPFYVCRKPEVSSLYRPNIPFLSMFPEIERFDILRTISIELDTLDNILIPAGIKDVDFIKIDTQGHDLAVLKGGRTLLKTALGVEVEVEFAPLYENQPLFDEVHAYLTSEGFSLYDVKRYYWRRLTDQGSTRKGRLIFGDAICFREPEAVLKMSDEKVLHAAYSYLAYGYVDCARELLKRDSVRMRIESILSPNRHYFGIPYFRGKERIQRMVQRIADFLRHNQFWTGTDSKVGN